MLLHAVMLLLLVSGIEKAVKLDEFQVATTGWTILPSGSIQGLSLAIVNGQLLISLVS